PAPGGPQPYALQSATETTGSGTVTQQYGYNASGDTTSRPGPNGQRTMSWDPQGNLSSVTDNSGTTGYIYDADANRLIRHDPAGATLYLPGTELRLASATGAVTATRYYTHAGRAVALRTAAGVTWLLTDPQN